METELGIGVIGMGWMGIVHGRSYNQLPDKFPDSRIRPRLVICADEVEARARSAQQRLGFARWSTDWQKVVSDPEVSVVHITAPNHMHLSMVRAAAEAGKHVFCEKPVGRSPQETAQIEQAVRNADVFSGVGYNYRWAPVVRFARQLIRDGRLGQITHFRGRFLVDYACDPNGVLSWRFQKELAGAGSLSDLMSHVVDMAHMLAGPLERVVASRKTFVASRPLAAPDEGTHFSTRKSGPRGEVTNEDYVGALAEFKCGARGALEVCRVIRGPRCEMAFEVNGVDGALKWNFERMNELELYRPDGTPEHEGPVLIYGSPRHPYYAQFCPGHGLSMSYDDLKVIEAYEFTKAIVDDRQGEVGFAEALAVAEVLGAMERSWETECWEHVRSLRITD